jgi:hypothetical protein
VYQKRITLEQNPETMEIEYRAELVDDVDPDDIQLVGYYRTHDVAEITLNRQLIRQRLQRMAGVTADLMTTTYVPLSPGRVHGAAFGAALATAQAAALYGTCVTCGGPLGPNDEDVCATCAGLYGVASAVMVMVETAA